MKRFILRCNDWNHQHVKFALFDWTGVNCGFITIATKDVLLFINRQNWNGVVDWNDKLPAKLAFTESPAPIPAPSQKTGPESP